MLRESQERASQYNCTGLSNSRYVRDFGYLHGIGRGPDDFDAFHEDCIFTGYDGRRDALVAPLAATIISIQCVARPS